MLENTRAQRVKSVSQWTFSLLFLFPMLPKGLANGLFVVFILTLVVSLFYIKPVDFWLYLKHNMLIVIPFIPYLIEFVLHPKNSVTGFELEKKLLFFISPFAVSLYLSVNKLKDVKIYMRLFVSSVFVISLYGLLVLLYRDLLFSPESYENGARILRHSFEDIVHIHPTYYSLFADVSIVWLLYDFKNYGRKVKVLLFFVIGIIVLQEVLVASRMPLIALVLCVCFMIYKLTANPKKRIATYIVFLLVLVALPFTVPSLKNRILDAKPIFVQDGQNPNKINPRVIIMDCDKTVFLDNFWLGLGNRNAQAALNSCYSGKQFSDSNIPIGYNSHNQFFTMGINYGIAFLLIFILTIVHFIRKVWSNYFAVLVMFSVVLVMFTESILERQWGVYFYVLFFLLFYNKELEKVKQI